MSPLAVAVLSAALLAASPAPSRSSAPPRRASAQKPRPPAPAEVPVPPPPDLKPRLPKMLVLDFAVQGEATKELGRTLADVAVREVTAIGGFKVLSQADVVAQLGVEQQRVLMGCNAESSCLAEIAGAIDADRTIHGAVTKLGDGVFLTVKMVDARKIAILGNAEEIVKSARPDELLEATRRVVHRAVTGRHRAGQAVIEFDVADTAARVLLDGEEIGRGPLKDLRRVADGSHRVVVAKDGYATWENVLQLEAGGRAQVAPKLIAVGGGSRVAGWTAFAAGVAAVGLTGGAVWQELQAKNRYADAKAMLGSGGVLPASANARAYQDAVSAGSSAHRSAVVLGVGAGAAAATSLVLGYLAYRQTGEIGPFRF